MTEAILRCCSNKPAFLITYELGSQYLVCFECMKLPQWSRSKKEVKKLEVENQIFGGAK